MGPVIEDILGLLMRLGRGSALLVAAFVALVLWLAARRAGRHGLELAVVLLGAAIAAFSLAVFAPRPPMTEQTAVALVLAAASLLVATATVVLWFGLRRRRRSPRVVKHDRPPWENGGW
jgi:uncharacterized membrane protein HdeD (DUF308 family)